MRRRQPGPGVVYALADERIADVLAVARQLLLDQYTATRDELARS